MVERPPEVADDVPMAESLDTGGLDSAQAGKRAVWGVYALAAILIVAGGMLPAYGHVEVVHIFGFYAIFGAVACVVLALAALALRKVVMRDEDYYTPNAGDGDDG